MRLLPVLRRRSPKSQRGQLDHTDARTIACGTLFIFEEDLMAAECDCQAGDPGAEVAKARVEFGQISIWLGAFQIGGLRENVAWLKSATKYISRTLAA